jgi:serine acetyltransferase
MPYEGPGRFDILVNRVLGSPLAVFAPLRALLRVVLHVEVPESAFQNGLRLVHPYNVIIHPNARIGKNVVVYHMVTLAVKKTGPHAGAPVLEDDVTIFPHAVVLGNVRVGRGAVIGAGSIVVRDVPAGASVAGNPARVVGGGAPEGGV